MEAFVASSSLRRSSARHAHGYTDWNFLAAIAGELNNASIGAGVTRVYTAVASIYILLAAASPLEGHPAKIPEYHPQAHLLLGQEKKKKEEKEEGEGRLLTVPQRA